jgi:hypothetical protein
MDDERLWTVEEIVRHFDVYISTVQGWIRQGHFEGARKKGPGRISPWVVLDSAIQAFTEKLVNPASTQDA